MTAISVFEKHRRIQEKNRCNNCKRSAIPERIFMWNMTKMYVLISAEIEAATARIRAQSSTRKRSQAVIRPSFLNTVRGDLRVGGCVFSSATCGRAFAALVVFLVVSAGIGDTISERRGTKVSGLVVTLSIGKS
jgi:hypothetical protein